MPKFILPLPPSLNHAYITTKTGKRIMTNECKAYKEAGYWKVKSVVKTPFPKLNSLTLTFYWDSNIRKDFDNAAKIVIDALKGALVIDDCWQCIEEITLKAGGIDRNNPRVEITWET